MAKKIILIIFLTFYIAILLYNFIGISKHTSANVTNTKIFVSVFDNAGSPINMATICIVEDKQYYHTNKHGSTEAIPIFYDNYNDRTWQNITLLVYKNGYSTHITYNLYVYKNQTRTGITITLNEIYNSYDNQTTITTENPPDELNISILKNYKRES